MRDKPLYVTPEMIEAGYALLKEAGEDWEHGTGWSPELDKLLILRIFLEMECIGLGIKKGHP